MQFIYFIRVSVFNVRDVRPLVQEKYTWQLWVDRIRELFFGTINTINSTKANARKGKTPSHVAIVANVDTDITEANNQRDRDKLKAKHKSTSNSMDTPTRDRVFYNLLRVTEPPLRAVFAATVS